MALKRTQKSGYPAVLGSLSQKPNPFIGAVGLLEVEGFHLDESGALTKWAGFQQYQTTPSVFAHSGELTPDVTGLFLFKQADGTRYEIATTKTKLWRFGVPSGSEYNELPLVGAGGDRTGTVDDISDFAALRDVLYIFNGVDGNLKYDGTTVGNMGLVAPTSTPTVVSGGAGVLTGNYSYKVTFYNASLGHESSPSAVSSTFAASGDTLNLSDVPVSPDAQVTRRRLYRTTTGGGIWLFLADIGDNTTTTFVDNISDASLGIQVELLANGVPPVAEIAEVYKGRVFMVPKNSSRVYFSDQDKPNAVHPNDFRDLDPDDGDSVTGIKRLFGQIIAFKNNSIWNGIGTDRFDFSFTRQVTGVGSVNHHSILTVPGKNILMFLSDQGFYSYDGVTERYESQRIEKTIRGLNQSRLSLAHGFVYKRLNVMAWLVSEGSSTKHDLMILYDYVQNMWTTRSLKNAKMQANVGAVIRDATNREVFFTGGYTTGEVYKGDTGLSDNGLSITTSVTDRALPRSDKFPDAQKSFFRVVIFFKPIADSSVTVSYALDDPDGSFTSLGVLATSDTSGQASFRFNARGRRIFFKFVGAAGTPLHDKSLVIRGWQVHYKNLGRIL